MTQPTNLGYCVFEVADLAAWKSFATEVIGLQLGEEDAPGESVTLRLDQYAARLHLVSGPADDIVAAGWEFPDEATLEAYVAEIAERGIEISRAQDELTSRRNVRRLYRCSDPGGLQHELYYGPTLAPSTAPFHSTKVAGGFATGRLGVGHIVSVTGDPATLNSFYRDTMGFSVSDHIRATTDLVPGAELEATFYHVAAGRHHSIAVAELPDYPKRLGHLMLETNDLTDVGLAFDRFSAAGIPILSTIGQHPNDRMVSFYAMTPAGFAIEVGWGGVIIDDASWQVSQYTQASLWGHRTPGAS